MPGRHRLPSVKCRLWPATPWAGAVDRMPPIRGSGWHRNQRVLAAACLLPLVLVVLWQEARYWKVRHIEAVATRGLDTLQAQLTPIFEARKALLDLRRTNLALLEALREPSQARLMDAVDRAIPSRDAEFREWRYQRGELTVLIEDRNPDPISLYPFTRSAAVFDQVRPKPHRNRDRVEITSGAGMSVASRLFIRL